MLVYTNINNEYIRLIIEGYVIPTAGKFRSKIGPLDARTNTLDLGKIIQGAIENESISIFNSTEDTLFIEVLNEHKHIKLTVEPQILEPEQSGEITIQFSTSFSELGKSITIINFEFNKKENKYNGQLSILANVVEDFSLLTDWQSANPPVISTTFQEIDLGRIKPNELTTKEIEIENRGKRDLFIHNIKTSNSMYSITPAKLIIGSGKKGVFQISIMPTAERNNVASKLTIISNDPDLSVISFTIIGKVDLPEGNSSQNMTANIRVEKAANIIKSFKGNDELVILDVRTEEEYDNGCLEDAINIDFDNHDFQKMLKLIDRQKTYLVYSLLGTRSKKAVDLMNGMGFSNIYHMHEGIEGWKALQLELVDPNK